MNPLMRGIMAIYNFLVGDMRILIGTLVALVGPDGLAQAFVVVEYGAESEGKDGGVLETICDDSCVLDPGFLIECFCRVMFTDDNC